MSEICNSSLNPSTKQVACTKIPNMPAALLFCEKGEKYEIVGDSIAADVVSNAPIVLTGIKTTVPVDTAATSQTLGDFTLTNDDECTGLTFGFVKTPCNVKSIQNVANSGKGGLLILTKNGVLIGKKVHLDSDNNYAIEPLDINSMSAAFPTGILADGSDLAATLTVNFGAVTKLINSAKVACIDVADEYPQVTGYDLTPGEATATTVSFIATDCAGAEASELVASEVYVNGIASTAIASSSALVVHNVFTATFAANVIVAGVNTLVLESTSKYGKTTFKYTA
jgi:hypothetical protein